MSASKCFVRRFLTLPLVVILLLNLAGCVTAGGIAFLKIKRIKTEDRDHVTALLDAHKSDEALTLADQMVAGAPDDYQGYTLRSTVHLALRQYDAAQADNVKALQLFEKNGDDSAKEPRAAIQAGIHENMALTALIAARRAPDDAQYQHWIKNFTEEAEKVKTLDKATWEHMRHMVESSNVKQ